MVPGFGVFMGYLVFQTPHRLEGVWRFQGYFGAWRFLTLFSSVDTFGFPAGIFRVSVPNLRFIPGFPRFFLKAAPKMEVHLPSCMDSFLWGVCFVFARKGCPGFPDGRRLSLRMWQFPWSDLFYTWGMHRFPGGSFVYFSRLKRGGCLNLCLFWAGIFKLKWKQASKSGCLCAWSGGWQKQPGGCGCLFLVFLGVFFRSFRRRLAKRQRWQTGVLRHIFWEES